MSEIYVNLVKSLIDVSSDITNNIKFKNVDKLLTNDSNEHIMHYEQVWNYNVLFVSIDIVCVWENKSFGYFNCDYRINVWNNEITIRKKYLDLDNELSNCSVNLIKNGDYLEFKITGVENLNIEWSGYFKTIWL